ncbi:F-box/LRR-repeat protein 7 [Fusarium oxysporum f. sp. cubense race 1]|uniref:F-box/LRR-repeat protein 7 n=1 Tax=Fusarium oxysporum f. sp. cubense (strain race 1) TaxID=1229664 RepID=N4TED6_FUSC1|nr:F-box/LRR-repeat protein 7 [Fusarium oxysporum f. sp. cubense race 1]
MRRGRSPSSPSPYRALAHHQQASAAATSSDSISLIRSFNVETNPTRPVRPSPLTASLIRDMPLDLVDRIRSFPLFMSAPEEFLVAIGNHLKPQIQSPNDHIVTEGDEAKAMYWLVRGVVAVTSRDGEAVYAELNPGSFFGEIGVLMQMPRTATIVAQMEKAIREEAQERLNLLKKKRQESGRLVKSPQGDFSAREPAPGEVSTGERGAIKDGAVVNNKKRKSPSPGIMEDPAAGNILHFLGLSVQPKSYTPFTDIVRQGLPGNEIFFIVRGEAEVIHDEPVYDDNIQNKAKAIPKRPRLKAGQYFGEVASLGLSRGRTATVRSITSVECIMITGDVLDEFWRRCPSDILKQVKETARLRYQKQSDDVVMVDVDVKEKVNKSDPPTPTTPTRASLPDLTFTTPSKPGSPAKDDTSNIAPKDPDPFLSVNMENIRNRRRHSLAPPVPPTDSSTPTTNGARSRLSEVTPIKFAFSDASADDDDVPAKRVRTTLPTRPITMSKPVLSDEILIYIFKHVDIGELFRLRLVSTHWRKLLTTSPKVCQDVDLSIYNRKVTDEVLIKVLAPFIGTRALSIDLNNCFHITDEGFGALWRSCGKNVKKWKMKSVWDVSANQILEMSENAKGLEEVDWSNCRKVGDNLLGRVVGWVVPDPPPSKSVVISSSAARSRSKQQQQKHAAQHVLPPGTVVGCPKLKRLNLSYCKHITDRSMAHLAAHASNRIESLSLTRCTSITDAGFQSWAPFRFEKLSRLCLADCTYLSDNAVVALVNSAKNLTHLDLSFCCALSDTATEVVALRLPKLRELRLAFCGSAVSDGSLESVALHLNDLEALSVRGCVRVTGRGVENVLNGCGRLNWMDVSQCRNLESWIRAGGVSNWGFDDRVGQRSTEPTSSETSGQGQSEDDGPAPKAMSVAMLTSQNFMPRSAFGYRAKRARRPVRFVIEKGFGSLR